MAAKWGSCALMVACLAILAGCRTLQPNLKPDDTKEQFVAPPMDARYESSAYPKQAFDATSDPSKRLFDEKKNAALMPARGPGMGSGGMPR